MKFPLEVIKPNLNKSWEISLKSSLETLSWFDKDISRGWANDAIIELNKDEIESNDNHNIMILESLSIADDLDHINISMIKSHPNSIPHKAIDIFQKDLQSSYANNIITEENDSRCWNNLAISKQLIKPKENEQFWEYDSDSINRELNTEFISSSEFKEGFYEPNTNIKMLKLLPATSPIKSKNDWGGQIHICSKEKWIDLTENLKIWSTQDPTIISIKPILKFQSRKQSEPHEYSININK